MLNFKFKVLGTNPDKRSTIYVSFRFGRNDKLMYRTPLKIEPKCWNFEKGQVKVSVYHRNTATVDNALQVVDGIITKFISQATIDGVPLKKEDIKAMLDHHFKPDIVPPPPLLEVKKKKGKEEKMDFHKFFERHIKLCLTRMNEKRGGQTVSYSTLRKYAKVYEQIKDFEKMEGVYLQFEDINQDFMHRFVAYLQSLNLSTNTIGHKITEIKVVLKRAFEQDLTTNTKFQFMKRQSESADNVALSEDELRKIADLNLSNDVRLAHTRDIFLVACWTGLRYSDVKKLRKEYISDGIIRITQTKTNSDVYIPLHPIVKEILERYDYQLPIISIQKFNNYIKEVCKLAEIDTPFVKSITRGGRRQSTFYKKWEVVSSHTARRSFATNLYLAGFPSISIMAVTGHKSEAAFLSYIKVSKAEHAKKLADYWKNNTHL